MSILNASELKNEKDKDYEFLANIELTNEKSTLFCME
jgi:hypothetical protein